MPKRKGREKHRTKPEPKKNNNNKKTIHHYIPKSRGGSSHRSNKKTCTSQTHQDFNRLFTNFRLKNEALIRFLQKFKEQRLIEHRHPRSLKKTKERWGALFTLALEPDEIIWLIKTFGKEIFIQTPEDERAWEVLGFKDLTDEEVIEKIKNEWSPTN